MQPTDDILDALTSDGDSCEVTDVFGKVWLLKLHARPDETYFTDIAEHGDVYGHTAFAPRRMNDYGHYPRPDGFDGAARKISLRDGSVWWQPPEDMRSRKAGGFETDGQYHAAFEQLERLVRDVIEFGFYVVGVTLHEMVTDSFGTDHLVEVSSAYIGGIEPSLDREYVRSVIGDCLLDLPELLV